ncbi:AhpC/TSA family protein [Natronincola peptidivorans]|nr:AhpC/TSA family protein [Natronincola peptidivorans]
MKKTLIFFSMIALMIIGGLVYFNTSNRTIEESDNLEIIDNQGITHNQQTAGEGLERDEVIGVTIGNIAPDFTLKNTKNQEESLWDYRGKNIVLNFFRST